MGKRLLLAGCLLAFACGGNGGSSGSSAPPDSAQEQGHVQVIGRTQSTAQGLQFSLAGTTILAHFKGTGLSVRLDEQSNGSDDSGAPYTDAYEVIVDGQAPRVLTTSPGDQTYPVASGLPDGEHTVMLVKRTESMVGTATLLEVTPEGGALLEPPVRSDRRIEFIGDSTVSGYGNEGATPDCPFTSGTENHYLSFARLTADALSAEEVSVSYSGKGVIRNLDGQAKTTMPDLYGRAVLVDSKSQWDFAQWVPQAVVIDLGTNDFVPGVPDADAFVKGYEAMVRDVRAHYPDAQILVTLGPLLSDSYPAGWNARTHAREDLQRVVDELKASGDDKVQFLEFPELVEGEPMGCDYHADVDTHAKLAKQLEATLHDLMGW